MQQLWNYRKKGQAPQKDTQDQQFEGDEVVFSNATSHQPKMHHLLLHTHLAALAVHCPTAHRHLSAVVKALLADIAFLSATDQDPRVNKSSG